MADLPAVIDDLNGLGSPFLVGHRPAPLDDPADASIECFQAARLVDPADDEMNRMVHAHAACRRMPVARHVASLMFQRYCHRACGVAVGAWVRHGINLDVTATNTVMRFVDGSPESLVLEQLAIRPDASAAGIVDTVVERHLRPMATVLSAQTGPGMGNLWGNIAAGFAGAFQTLSRHHDTEWLRAQAEELMTVSVRLERGGTFRTMSGPNGPRLRYDRKSCCHWYAAPDGRYCSWCSKISVDERTRRFREIVDSE